MQGGRCALWQLPHHFTGWVLEREDDYASNGLRGLADFVKALLKVIEAQARGFAHGHRKVHSSPDGLESLEKCLENIVREIQALEQSDSASQPEEEVVERMVEQETASYNNRLMASASTRQYESARLPARQLGHDVLPEPFSAKQRRQSRYDGEMEADGETQRANMMSCRRSLLRTSAVRTRKQHTMSTARYL